MILFSDLRADIIAEIEGLSDFAEKAIAGMPSSRAVAPGTHSLHRKRNPDQPIEGPSKRAKKAIVNMPSSRAVAPGTYSLHRKRNPDQPIEGPSIDAEKAIEFVPSRRAVAPGPYASWMIDDIINKIIAQSRTRSHVMVAQLSNDRRCEHLLASLFGITRIADAAERRKKWKTVTRLRKLVETGKPPADLSPDIETIILSFADSRKPHDQLRAALEQDLTRLVRVLPIWHQWAKSVSGLGELSIAAIIGHAGNLADYSTKSRLWKRMGVAVIDGERQRKCTNLEKALEHGYSPQRRSAVYLIGECVFRAQWRGRGACLRAALADHPGFAASEHAAADLSELSGPDLTALAEQFGVAVPEGEPSGPYGALYARRRANTASREGWSPAHQHADALRYMTKKLLSHARSAWIAHTQGSTQ